jgi:hypothetical protein
VSHGEATFIAAVGCGYLLSFLLLLLLPPLFELLPESESSPPDATNHTIQNNIPVTIISIMCSRAPRLLHVASLKASWGIARDQ